MIALTLGDVAVMTVFFLGMIAGALILGTILMVMVAGEK